MSTTLSPTITFDVDPTERELAMRASFERWLEGLPEDPDRHARFVNTLSMLEHIGSVKIAQTQSGLGITEEALEHLAEETRHAHYLKRLARKIDPDVGAVYSEDSLLAGRAARSYFARLEVRSHRFSREHLAGNDAGTYLLVSWLIERRAMWLYPAYQEVLNGFGRGYSVRTIIGDETDHLREMTEGLERMNVTANPALSELVRDEEGLFERMADAMMNADNDAG